MVRSTFLLVCLVSLALLLTTTAAADPMETDGCVKFHPDTMMPYYDADCGRTSTDATTDGSVSDADASPDA